MNLSSTILNPEEIKILSKGLGFAVSPKNIPFKSIICNIENGTQGLSSNDRELLRQECSLALLKSKRPRSNLDKEGREALKSIRNNDKIVVLKADKGGATMVLNKEDYIHKMNEHLSCGSYKKVNSNPIPKVMR